MHRLAVLVVLAACRSPQTPMASDRQHDFDWELGTWRTSLRRLKGTEWLAYTGTTVVRPVWGGRANLVELEVDGPAGHIEALSLRLYDPGTQRWSLNFANSRSGELSPPSIGQFANGRGEFFSDEVEGGKPIRVRFVITQVSPDSARFEQAVSADGGATWDVNWIATDTRVP